MMISIMNKKKLSYEEYGKTVKNLRKEISDKDEDIQKRFFQLKNVIDKFSLGNKESIDFYDLDNLFDLNKWESINPKVKVRKIYSSDDVIKFETTIEKGGVFGWHCHGDCIELTEVLKGKLFDSVTNKTFNEGESVVYNPMEYHTPGGLVYTELLVTFNRV